MGSTYIRKLNLQENIVSTIGNGKGIKDGNLNEAIFEDITGITLDKCSGDILLLDANRIRKIELKNSKIITVTKLAYPATLIGLCVDNGSNYYTCATLLNQIIKICCGTYDIVRLAGTGEEGLEDGPAMYSKFKYPCSVTLGKNNTLWIADEGNKVIRMVTNATKNTATIKKVTWRSDYTIGNLDHDMTALIMDSNLRSKFNVAIRVSRKNFQLHEEILSIRGLTLLEYMKEKIQVVYFMNGRVVYN